MNKKQADRFATLYHYVKNEVTSAGFDIEDLVSKGRDCGTVACLAGWCSIIFPKSWGEFDDDGKTKLRGHGIVYYDVAFSYFFGIDHAEAIDLTWYPSYTRDKRRGIQGKREALRRMRLIAGKYGWVLS